MFFRRPKSPSRADDWLELAKKLELIDAADSERMLRGLLNLEADVQVGPIYSLQLAETERLYLFDYQERLQGVTPQTVTVCLLSSRKILSTLSLRASRKLHKALESLNASATGSQRLDLDDPEFAEQVTVYAREAAASRLLNRAVKDALLRALCKRNVTPTFLLGEHHMLLSNRNVEPTALGVLESLSSDLLSLYAAFSFAD